jgi:hypothetical protein
MTPRKEKAVCSIAVCVAAALLALALLSSFAMAQFGAAGEGENQPGNKPIAATGEKIRARYGQLPLGFEPNVGQTDHRVKFLSRGRGYTLFFTQDQALVSLRSYQGHALEAPAVKHPFQTAKNTEEEQRRADVFRMELVGANRAAKVSALDELPGKSNYFLGNNPSKWRTNIPTYSKLKYEGIYPGIDLVYYGNQRQLEYDFVVNPGAAPSDITLQVETGNSELSAQGLRLKIAPDGDLMVETDEGALRFHKPVVYQPAGGSHSPVVSSQVLGVSSNGPRRADARNPESQITNPRSLDARYVLSAGNRIHFEISDYDKSRPLVIDPVLSYSTYLGGTGDEMGSGIKVDASGNAYIVGSTDSTDFPVSPAAYQKTNAGGTFCIYGSPCGDAFVTKLSADGTALVYSTFLGGSGAENGIAIAIDTSGNAYLTGSTGSTNFPVTLGVFQPTCGPGCLGNAFISKLSPDGSSLVYSTYLGGSDQGFTANLPDVGSGVAVDSSGNAYVTGMARSTDFPVTSGAFQTTMPNTTASGFVAKLNPNASALIYSTYLGGSVQDAASAIAVDTLGNAYVTGQSSSPDFPTTNGAFQIPFGTTADVVPTTSYVTKLSPDGSSLVYSASLGGTGGTSIAVDSSGSAYVTGGALDFFPTTSEALGSNCDTGSFVTKLMPDGSGVNYSTQYCALSGAVTLGLAVDSSGSAYLTGETSSTAFPATAGALQTAIGNACCFSDAFLTKLTPDGTAVVYSTYLGGSSSDQGSAVAVDSSGNAYLTGSTESADFPTANPFQATYAGGGDAFVSKISIPTTTFTLLPATMAFGNLGVGVTSTSQPGTLVNLSGGALAISSVTTKGDFAQSNNCGNSLAAGAQCSIQVTFKPSVAGAATGTLSVTAAGSTQSVTLSGTGVNGPVVSLLPSTPAILNPPYPLFVNQPVGTTSPPLTVTVNNIGNAQLTINSETLQPGGIFGFAGTHCSVVAPQANCAFSVTYTTSGSPNGDSAFLTINDNAGDSPQAIHLIGLGAPAGLRFLSFGLKFNNQPAGSTSAAQTATLMNGTGAEITLGKITTTGDFAQTNNCGSTLNNGAYCTFSVTFTPTGTGVRLGTVQVAFNGSGSPTILSLLGSNGGTETVAASPASLSFSPQDVGTTSSAQTVTLSNRAITPLPIASISVTGTDAADFAATDNCGGSVAAGSSCTIDVTFTPTAGGTRTATLSIADSALGNPQTVSLTGTGQDFSLGMASGSPSTATVTPGQTATYSLALGGLGGLSQAVSFACAGAPSEATCTVSPSTATPSASGSVSITVTVATTAPSLAAPRERRGPPAPLGEPLGFLTTVNGRPFGVALFGLLALLSLRAARPSRKPRRNEVRLGLAIVTLAMLTLLLGACGGGGGTGNKNPGTPAGTYTLTITGTLSGSTALQHSTTLTLQVS